MPQLLKARLTDKKKKEVYEHVEPSLQPQLISSRYCNLQNQMVTRFSNIGGYFWIQTVTDSKPPHPHPSLLNDTLVEIVILSVQCDGNY